MDRDWVRVEKLLDREAEDLTIEESRVIGAKILKICEKRGW